MAYLNDDPKKNPEREKEEEKKRLQKEKENDKFSPGEPDDYNAEEFSTD